MKKIYALAALVLTAGLSASAATNAPEKAMKAISLQEYMETSSASLPIKAKAQGPAKAINSVSDLYGLYSMSYRGASTKDTLNHIEAGMITEGPSANQVIIPFGNYSPQANVNIARKTITLVNKTPLREITDAESGQPVLVSLYIFTRNAQGKRQMASSVRATIEDDGSFAFDPSVLFAVSTDELVADVNKLSAYMFATSVSYARTSFLTPVASDYEVLGEGKFYDTWINSAYNEANRVPEQTVTYLQNKTNKNLLAVQNPYDNPAWDQINMATDKNGYILLNLENPDFVGVMPLVESGMVFDMGTETEPDVQGLYCYNHEGNVIYTNGDIEATIEEWLQAGDDISNVTGNIATIYHGLFGTTSEPAATYQWVDSNRDSAMIPGIFELPWTSGIANIDTDNNASVKYYNLQGVEISKPVKGQIVIVKKGNKAIKSIAR